MVGGVAVYIRLLRAFIMLFSTVVSKVTCFIQVGGFYPDLLVRVLFCKVYIL